MNNQEPNNQIKTSEADVVENRRRFIKGASLTTPVILTLTSSSVFGAQLCLSQQLSGTLSGHPTGNCVTGNTPLFWQNPLNSGSWPAGFSYGTLPPATPATCANYIGGTTFDDVMAFNAGSILSLREILCNDASSTDPTWATALLNSLTVTNYTLSKNEVLALYNGTLAPPPPFANTDAGKIDFLLSTW